MLDAGMFYSNRVLKEFKEKYVMCLTCLVVQRVTVSLAEIYVQTIVSDFTLVDNVIESKK